MPPSEVVPGCTPAPSTTLVYDALSGDGVRDYRSFLEGFIDPTDFQRVVAICFGGVAEELIAQWEPLVGESVADFGVIDVGRTVASSSDANDRQHSSSTRVQGVDATDDPAAVLAALRGHCGPVDAAAGPVLCLVDTLEPYVSGLSSDAVRSFVDAFTYYVRGIGAQAWVWMDADTDDWVRQGVADSFDAVLHHDEDGVTDVGSPGAAEAFSPDEAFDLLTPPRRRYLLHALAITQQPSLSLDDLVAWIDRWDAGATSERRTRLHLLHTDIPKLDRSGVIRFDPSTGDVEPLEPFASLQSELRRTAPHDFGTDRP